MTNDTDRPATGPRKGAFCDSDRAFSSTDTTDTTGAPGDMTILTRDFAETLASPAAGPDMLRRQARLLDEMLMVLMTDNVAGRLIEYGSYMCNWVYMMLRIQKQCADTVKKIEAIDYMKSVAARSCASGTTPHPPPPETGEQTIKEGAD